MKAKVNKYFVMIPVVIMITVVIMCVAYTGITDSFQDNDAGAYDKYENAEHDVLQKQDSYYDDTIGKYIQIAKTKTGGDLIAFAMDEDQDVIEYGAGSYYPESYWKGDSTYENMASKVFLSHEYREENSSEIITDISGIEDEKYYYSYGDTGKGYRKGSGIKQQYDDYTNVRCYDISSYIGFERSDFDKNKTQIIGKGFAILMMFPIGLIGLVICIVLLIGGIRAKNRRE